MNTVTITKTITATATLTFTRTVTVTMTPVTGPGTAVINPLIVQSGIGGETMQIIYTAGGTDWTQFPGFGTLKVSIPEGWTLPSFSSDGGYVTVYSTALIAAKEINGRDIIIYISGLKVNEDVIINYGDKINGGTGVVPGQEGRAEFIVAADSSGVNPKRLVTVPVVDVIASNVTVTVSRTWTVSATVTASVTKQLTQTPTFTVTSTFSITPTPADTAAVTPCIPSSFSIQQNGVYTELKWATSENTDYYRVYASTGAKGKFKPFPAEWSLIATVQPTPYETSFVFTDVTGNTYTYYSVTGVNSCTESARTKMGTKVIMWFNYTEGGKNTYRVSLPFEHKFHSASDIIREIEGNETGPPVKIDNISIWNAFSQSFIPYGYKETAGTWLGVNWIVDCGTCSSNAIYLHAISQFGWTIAGTDKETTLRFCYNASAPNANKREIPYTCNYSNAVDIVNEIEGGTGKGSDLKINKVGLWNKDSQAYTIYGYNDFLESWGGINFELKPGDSINLYPSGNQSSFTWQPVLVQ